MLPALESGRFFHLPWRHLVLLLLGAVFAWNLDLRWQMLYQHRTELGGVEHNVIHGIQKVMLGQDLYEDPERPPFDVIQYTPGYYLLCASVGKIIGLDGNDARSIFLLSRWLSLLLWLVTGALVVAACRAGGATNWSSWFAAGITLCCAWEQSFSRMDSLVAATTTATLLCFIRWLVSGGKRMLVIASIAAVAGVFAKQSGIVLLVSPLLYLLFTRNWKALLIALGSMVLATAVALVVISSLGTFTAFYQNTVLGLRNGFSWMLYIDLFNPPTYKYFIGWHVLAVIVTVTGFRSRSAPLRFMALVLPISLVFALTSGLKYGSRLNYLHESLMLTFIGVAILLPQVAQTQWRNALAWAFAGYGLLFSAFRTNSTAAWYRVGEPDDPHEQHLLNDQAVHAILVNELGLKRDEYVFITYREYLEHLLVGQSLLTQKDIIQFSKDRLFDYTEFHTCMEDGRVRFVITDGATGPIHVLDSTYTGWVPIREVKGRVILARAPRR